MRLSSTGWAMAAGVAAMMGAAAADAQAPAYPVPYPVAPPYSVARPMGPPPVAASPEAAEIAACLCLRQAVDGLAAEMATRQRAYDEVHGELSRLDAELERERTVIDVNNPQSVARFRQLLQQRDAVFRRSTGPVTADLSGIVERYNARSNEYNARCADRPRDAALLARAQASLSCPAP